MHSSEQRSPPKTLDLRRASGYLAVIIAGGTVYLLPYLRQSYHNTLLSTLGLTNTELGYLSTAFGITAMACYFPSGWLADRFAPRRLLCVSLLCTGLSGLYFATFPPYRILIGIYIFWGICTVLTFWSAAIKAVRDLGNTDNQGRTFGGFEAGRGVVEGAVASVAVFLFTTRGEGQPGLAAVIVVYSLMALIAAAAVFFLNEDPPSATSSGSERGAYARISPWVGLRRVFGMQSVWLLAVVVLAAYGAYWGTFNIAPFAEDVFGVDPTASAKLSTFRMWIRALAPVAAGWAADRFRPSRTIVIAFGVMAGSLLALVFIPSHSSMITVLWIDTAIAALAIFTLRGIYFALMQEGRIPTVVTGTAVGVVSLVGYTPDIWSPLLVGWLLDTWPGGLGHRYYFAFLAVLCGFGAAAALAMGRLSHGASIQDQPIPSPGQALSPAADQQAV